MKPCVPLEVLQCSPPIAPIAEASGVAVSFLAEGVVIVKEARVCLVCAVEAVLAILQFYHPLGSYRICEFEGLLVFLFVRSCLFGDEIQLEVLV